MKVSSKKPHHRVDSGVYLNEQSYLERQLLGANKRHQSRKLDNCKRFYRNQRLIELAAKTADRTQTDGPTERGDCSASIFTESENRKASNQPPPAYESPSKITPETRTPSAPPLLLESNEHDAVDFFDKVWQAKTIVNVCMIFLSVMLFAGFVVFLVLFA